MCILRVGPFSPNFIIFYLLEVYPPPPTQIAKGLLSTPNPSTLLAEEAVLLAELVLLLAHLTLLASLCGGGGGGGGQLKEDVMEGVRSEGVGMQMRLFT